MRALVFDGSLTIQDVPVPEPKTGEVLIRVLCSAICNTDLEIIRGYMDFRGIPGHEFVGEVAPGFGRLSGKKVVGEINCSCGDCYLCRTGRPTHCSSRTVLGIKDHPGVFAEYTTLPERNLHEVPSRLSAESAVFTEPLAAAVEITEQLHLKPSQKVFIFGAGKLGLLISMVIGLHGCQTVTFDPDEEKVYKARAMGIQAVPLSKIGILEKAEICIDATGSPDGIQLALAHLYPAGKLVLKTTVAHPAPIDLNQIVINEFEITGSRCGPFAPAISLLSQGMVDPRPLISKTFAFSDILEAFHFSSMPGTLKVLIRH